MEKELKIEIPEGYEIDTEKSTFEKIIFKKKVFIVNCWKDIKSINGVYIDAYSEINECVDGSNASHHHNVFLNEKYAKSALALAKISQLLPYYDTNVDWDDTAAKHCIYKQRGRIVINTLISSFEVLAFNTRQEAERFLKYNESLIKDYLMID